MDFNKSVLFGRVGRDPESRKMGEKTLASFSLATSYGTGDKIKTEWHQVTAWDKLAEIAMQVIHKGDRVLVEGRISYNVVGEGEARKTYTQIVATNLINSTPKSGDVPSTTGSTTKTSPVVDEDIPF